MRNIIDRINKFEAGEETVFNFNKIFSEVPLLGFSATDLVKIGEPCSPEIVRMIKIGDKEFRHSFKPVTESEMILEESL
jgi:hypothetical protein